MCTVLLLPGVNPIAVNKYNITPIIYIYIYILLIVLFYVLFMCKCVLYYCCRVSTKLQLTNISYCYTYNIYILLIVLFYVLFMCKCVLCYCCRVSTKLQLTNVSYIILSIYIFQALHFTPYLM